MSVEEFATVEISVAGQDITGDVIWRETTFTQSAAAMPGTFSLSIRDPSQHYSFLQGKSGIVELVINGKTMYKGYTQTIEYGYLFGDLAERKWRLQGLDLNILLDRLIMYNHRNPALYPDGGGHYIREAVPQEGAVNTTAGWIVTVPQGTEDWLYILTMMADFDLPGGVNDPTGAPKIYCERNHHKVSFVSVINPDGIFTPPGAGTTLRTFLQDVSTSVLRQLPGSTIWYIDPEGYIVYKSVEENPGPVDSAGNVHSVGDDNEDGWAVRDLTVSIDISHIKNDVLVFTGEASPLPGSEQELLLFKHNSLTESTNRYGRFQWSEVIGSTWLQIMINARSTKLLFQEGGPAVTADFTIFRSGFHVDQLVTISSSTYTYRRFDPTFGEIDSGTILLPVRAIEMTFPTPNVVAYHVTCSYDTQDPFGLLLALKRPASRGITRPNFNVIDLRPGYAPGPYNDTTNPRQPGLPMMHVREYPVKLSGNKWQCTYSYIRNSLMVVTVDPKKGGRRLTSFPPDTQDTPDPSEPTPTGTAGYVETSPENGEFLCDDPDVLKTKKIYVEYHVWGERQNAVVN